MNFDELICNGELPWNPNKDVTGLDVWHEAEIPMAGTFVWKDNVTLFAALGDIDSTKNTTTWAYVVLRREPPRSFEDVDAMWAWIEDEFVDSSAAFSYANDLSIVRYSQAKRVGSLYDGAATFLTEVVQALQKKMLSARAQVSVRQAEAEVIEKELAVTV